ncbi:MAG: hypothetical protein BWY11_01425 [Firmicutes bacterium ADurb.Bin182]|nr:MAG: hypothetical protein BWY11_01425 [Firmicutes bacterium ADurb.Bin182]
MIGRQQSGLFSHSLDVREAFEYGEKLTIKKLILIGGIEC